jgi:hypothetical protein
VDAAALARKGERRAGQLVSDSTARRRTTLKRTAKSCGPGHPLLMLSLAEAPSAQPGYEMPFNPQGEGDKKELVAGESSLYAVKPLRGECRMFPVPPL